MDSARLKLIVAGKGESGKTSLIRKFVGDGQMDVFSGHEGFVEKRLTVDNSVEMTVELREYPDKARNELQTFVEGAHCCCLVFSTTDKESFDLVVDLLSRIVHCGPFPVVLVENKIDLIEESVLDEKRVEALAKSYKLRLYRVSATQDHNVKAMFKYILEKGAKFKSNPGAGMSRSLSAESTTSDGQPSRRRTGGVKPVFNRHRCPVM